MAETTVLRSSASPRNVSAAAQGGAPHAQLSSSLPLVNVVMGGVNGGQPVQQDGKQPKQGVVVMPMRGKRSVGQQRQALGRGPARTADVAPAPALNDDQLLLCRHLVQQFIETDPGDDNAKLAAATITAIDEALAAATAAAALAAEQQQAQAQQQMQAGTPKRVVVSTASRSQANVAAPPRRVVPSRGQRDPNAAPPPMLNVDMRTNTITVEETGVIDVPDAG